MMIEELTRIALADWRQDQSEKPENPDDELEKIAKLVLTYVEKKQPLNSILQCVVNKCITYVCYHESSVNRIVDIFKNIFLLAPLWTIEFDDNYFIELDLYSMNRLCRFSPFFQTYITFGIETLPISKNPGRFYLSGVNCELFSWFIQDVQKKAIGDIDFKELREELYSWSKQTFCAEDKRNLSLPTILEYRLLLKKFQYKSLYFKDLLALTLQENYLEIPNFEQFEMLCCLHDFFVEHHLTHLPNGKMDPVMITLGEHFGEYLRKCYLISPLLYKEKLKNLTEKNVLVISIYLEIPHLLPHLAILPDSTVLYINGELAKDAFNKFLIKLHESQVALFCDHDKIILIVSRIQNYFKIKLCLTNQILLLLSSIYRKYLDFNCMQKETAVKFLQHANIVALDGIDIGIDIDYLHYLSLEFLIVRTCTYHVTQLKDLKELVIAGYDRHETGDNIHDEDLLSLQNCKNLKSLTIKNGNNLTGIGFKGLPSSLSRLIIEDCSGLMEISLANLPDNLTHLELYDGKLTNAAGFPLKHLTNLQKLILKGFDKIDKGILTYLPIGMDVEIH